ncbi:hypothetical protein H5368_11460 [Luteimonas sp. MC1782]|uniref:hypothetical protein n=1 Tax=Luteimonas sp. MC1782 TaxID=2760305 RepID=UPI001602468B|nr:hypothetical protein [Luteimonas sp. MC1782]MBB1473654.1 hypothetical protein [Luteimonas sp. MC1782]
MSATPRAAAAVLCTVLFAPHAVGAQEKTEPRQMHEEDHVARTVVEGEGARLEVAFDPEGDALAVRYRVSNTGQDALAVFDRGDRHAVMTKKLVAGDIPAPRFEDGEDGLVLLHAARALPSPSPTVPPVPLASKLAAGDSRDGAFAFDLSLGSAGARVRWCLGVEPFDDAAFEAADSAGDVAVWTASFDMAQTQQMLCTPWFDPATGTFEAG